MPTAQTIPLYNPTPPDADGWHAVVSPGGYEWWYFDAEDAKAGLRFVAILFQGFVFHPGYLRAYKRYISDPTRRKPPLPGDYPCAYLAVYENDRLLQQFMSQVSPDEFEASESGPDVRIGASSCRRQQDGTICVSMIGTPWDLTWQGPRQRTGASLSAAVVFRPSLTHPEEKHERPFLSREMTGATHRWIIANPLCQVTGEIRLDGSTSGDSRTLPFDGVGYHDHNFGTGPIGVGLRRWFWGRIPWPGRVLTFHCARPTRKDMPDEVHMIEADSSGVREHEDVKCWGDWIRQTPLGLRYPAEIRFGNPTAASPQVSLVQPRIIDASPFYLRLSYEATIGSESGVAFCEIAYPSRLRWPVLGRMIEMSIGR